MPTPFCVKQRLNVRRPCLLFLRMIDTWKISSAGAIGSAFAFLYPRFSMASRLVSLSAAIVVLTLQVAANPLLATVLPLTDDSEHWVALKLPSLLSDMSHGGEKLFGCPNKQSFELRRNLRPILREYRLKLGNVDGSALWFFLQNQELTRCSKFWNLGVQTDRDRARIS